jgi:hypothetical protein
MTHRLVFKNLLCWLFAIALVLAPVTGSAQQDEHEDFQAAIDSLRQAAIALGQLYAESDFALVPEGAIELEGNFYLVRSRRRGFLLAKPTDANTTGLRVTVRYRPVIGKKQVEDLLRRLVEVSDDLSVDDMITILMEEKPK